MIMPYPTPITRLGPGDIAGEPPEYYNDGDRRQADIDAELAEHAGDHIGLLLEAVANGLADWREAADAMNAMIRTGSAHRTTARLDRVESQLAEFIVAERWQQGAQP